MQSIVIIFIRTSVCILLSNKMQKLWSCYLIGLHENKTAELAQPRNRSIVTRPLSSRERQGSGYETRPYIEFDAVLTWPFEQNVCNVANAS